MKKIILITILMAGLTVSYSFAQMGQGHMMDNQPGQAGNVTYGGEHYPCPQMSNPGMMGYGGYGMMGHMGGMMGGMIGPGYGQPMGGMMGPGYGNHMGGMMEPGYGGHMGGMMGGRGMMGYGGGYGMRGYDAESIKEYQKEYRTYMDDTAGLRKRLHNMKFDYNEALRNPELDREKLRKLDRELRDLQWELYEKAPRN